MSVKNLTITWTTQGETTWEDWWVKQYGRTRTKMPSKEDYLSFANYDLQKNGCSKIIEKDGKLEIHKVSGEQMPTVTTILYYHGFEIVSIEDDYETLAEEVRKLHGCNG